MGTFCVSSTVLSPIAIRAFGGKVECPLQLMLVAYSPSIRIIVPPVGVKDAREWKRQGVTAAKVLEAIDAATVRRLTIKTSVRKRKTGAKNGN